MSLLSSRVYRRKRINFLKHLPLIKEVIVVTQGLNRPDFDILLYLDDVVYFTRRHFDEGMYWQQWDTRRWSRLIETGWVIKFHEGTGRGDPGRYKLTIKARQMVSKVYKMCYGEELIPTISNPIMKAKTYKHGMLKKSIEIFNQEIRNDERSK